MKIVNIIAIAFFFFVSCNDNQDGSDFGLTYPDYFPEPYYTFGKNRLSKQGFELGRSLFHDPILSVDSTISCISCHAQGHAFADHNVALSSGVNQLRGTRNSPSMANLAWQTSFMWDGGINHIEVMPVAPITNPLEMDETMANVVTKLNKHATYPGRFERVFNTKLIDDQKLLFVLAQYMSMLVSADAKYDKFRLGKSDFTPDELSGYLLFKEKCASCHKEPLFTDFSFRNNGLEINTNETGRYKVTLDQEDYYTFKVPSLRNVAITYPYMHDGRFRTLRQVLDHYEKGIQNHFNLDPILSQNGTLGISMTEDEKDQLISFLNTLTDFTFIANPLYSE